MRSHQDVTTTFPLWGRSEVSAELPRHGGTTGSLLKEGSPASGACGAWTAGGQFGHVALHERRVSKRE